MKLSELFASIEAARPGRDDVVYLARRGDEYDWRIVSADGVATDLRPSGEPDVWMSFSAAWPVDDPWPHTH